MKTLVLYRHTPPTIHTEAPLLIIELPDQAADLVLGEEVSAYLHEALSPAHLFPLPQETPRVRAAFVSPPQ